MFKSISWQTYLQIVAIVSGMYYCAVILIFYRKEAGSLIRRLISPKPNKVLQSTIDSTPHTEILQQKMDELRGILFRAGRECNKQQLLASLQDSLAGYDGLHLSLHKDALILFVSTQAMQICGLDLSDREIEEGIPALGQ